MFFRTHRRRIYASLLAVALLAPQSTAAATAAGPEVAPLPGLLGAAMPQPFVFRSPVEMLLAQVGPLPPARAPQAQRPLLPVPSPGPRPAFKMPALGGPHGAVRRTLPLAARTSSAHAATGPPVSSIADLQRAPRDQRAAVARFLQRLGTPAAPGSGRTVSPAQPGRRVTGPGASSVRRASTVDVNSLNVTGLKPWWHFERGVVPGVGAWLVNDYWQNLVLRAEDMNVPYRGVDFAFRRTYNSFSGHDYEDTNGASEIGQFGAGWTNTFDAHMSLNNCAGSGYDYYGTGFNGFSIYDVDGARYDYCFDANGTLQPPPGMEGTTLKTIDGGSFFWTTKDGTTYDFYAPYYGAQWAAYNGRLYRIWGRNSNNALQFSYGWDATAAAPNGDSSSSAYLRHMWVTTDSGLQAHLYFDDFSGRRLCSSLTFPDNATTVNYWYDAAGQMWLVGKPGNNSTATRYEGYINYHTQWMVVAGPRWMGSWNGSTSTDGSYAWFSEIGNANAQVNAVNSVGYVNFTPDDNTGTLLQPNSPQLTGLQTYRAQSIGIYAGYTTMSDSDGHQEIQYMDGYGRPTEHDLYTGSQTLKTYRSWDAHNNPVYDIDANNNRTDYTYDANSNLTVVGFPMVYTLQGGFRPTKLMDYDGNNNLTAYCDETAVHASGHDYPNVGSGSQCAALAGNQPHVQLHYTPTSAEPYGELDSMTTPRGYTWHYGYTVGYQGGGADYGLVTEVQGDQIVEYDGTPRTPITRRVYDAHGRTGCSVSDANDAHTVQVVMHDVLGRVTALSDPDDASLQPNVNCAKSSSLGAGAALVTRATYYADSSIATTQTPGEALAGVSTSFTYDMEGNLKSEVRHRSGQTAMTRKWYDSANRLVEVELPQQLSPNRTTTGGDYAYSLPDFYGSTWLTRYWYGLTGTANPPGMNGPAYGNIFQIAEYTRSTLDNTTLSWQATRGFVYDAMDRPTAYTHYADNYGQLGLNASEVYQYDSAGQGGQLSTKTKAGSTEFEFFNYDALGRVVTDGFMDVGGGQVTPGHTYVYDANGRIAKEQSIGPGAGFGAVQFAYDADGNLTSKADVGGTYNDAPSTISYGYYPDGMRANLSVTAQSSGGFTQQNLFSYGYRPDGLMRRETVQMPPAVSQAAYTSGDFTWTYTGGGRLTMRTDPLTYTAISGLSGSSVRRAALSARRLDVPRGASQPVAAEVADKVAASQQRSMRAVSAHEPKHRPIITRRADPNAGGKQAMIVQGPCPMSVTRTPQGANARSTSVIQSCCDPSTCGPDPTPPPDPTPGPPTPTPAPTATPQPAKTFAPIAVGYDTAGRVNTYQIPSGGQYTNFHYGPEDDLTDYSGFGDASHAPVHVVDAYNVRGEMTGEHFFNNSGSTGAYDHTWPNSDQQPANGAMLPANPGNGTSFNTRSAEITFNQTVSTFNAYNGALCQQPISQMQWTPDASGRHVAGFAYELAFRPPDCNTADGIGGHLTRTYDTADHLVRWSLPQNDYWPGLGQFLYCQATPFPDGTPAYVRSATGTINYGWGPENMLVQRQVPGGSTTNIHWDGSAMLFTTDGAGHVTNLKIGSDADILPNTELLVRDRDWTGQVVMSHDPTGYSPWQPPNPTHDACTPNNAPTFSPNFDGPHISDATFTQLAADGYSDGYNTFQGARTFDPKMGQWTTQDAIIGNVHDPMSAKAYTWNRGNPRQFVDPDGRQAYSATLNFSAFNVAVSQWSSPGSRLLAALVRGLAIGRTALMGPIGGIGLALMPISAGEDGVFLRRVLFAANGMSGENSATRLGREMHKNYQPPDDPNCKKDFKIPGTDWEADCYNEETGDLYELKPNTKRQIARGIAQLWRYQQALLKAGMRVRHMYVDTYTPGVPGSYVPTVSPIGGAP